MLIFLIVKEQMFLLRFSQEIFISKYLKQISPDKKEKRSGILFFRYIKNPEKRSPNRFCDQCQPILRNTNRPQLGFLSMFKVDRIGWIE